MPFVRFFSVTSFLDWANEMLLAECDLAGQQQSVDFPFINIKVKYKVTGFK